MGMNEYLYQRNLIITIKAIFDYYAYEHMIYIREYNNTTREHFRK